jgi:hypothetical protein
LASDHGLRGRLSGGLLRHRSNNIESEQVLIERARAHPETQIGDTSSPVFARYSGCAPEVSRPCRFRRRSGSEVAAAQLWRRRWRHMPVDVNYVQLPASTRAFHALLQVQ